MHRRLLSLLLAAALAGLVVVACSGESEGQRCELTDDPGGPNDSPGSSDCAGNLVCYAAGTLGGQSETWKAEINDPNFGICCPLNRDQATTSVCGIQPSPPGGNAAPPDGGASDGAAQDGGDASSSDGQAGDTAPTSDSSSPDAPSSDAPDTDGG